MKLEVKLNDESRNEDVCQITLGFYELNRLVNWILPIARKQLEVTNEQEEIAHINKALVLAEEALTKMLEH